MRTLPPDRDSIVERFASLFGDSVWPRARALLLGAMLVSGRRTVASVLRVTGLSEERRFKHYHRVLSRAHRSALRGSRRLLGLVIDRFIGKMESIGREHRKLIERAAQALAIVRRWLGDRRGDDGKPGRFTTRRAGRAT